MKIKYKSSTIAPEWWDYTSLNLDKDVVEEIANLSPDDILSLERPGFKIKFYESIEEFYLAEAFEYIEAWSQSSEENPTGICGPIGPTEQLPLVAQIVNELGINLKHSHFWLMDEWIISGREVDINYPLSFRKTFLESCYNRINKDIVMPVKNVHFPKAEISEYIERWDKAECLIMQGGQGDIKHWAFNEPPQRADPFLNRPPSFDEYSKLATRILDLHPLTISQNARTACGGNLLLVPDQAVTVGPIETWKSKKVSIWHAGTHDNPFGQRLTTYMISKGIADSTVPMSLLANHPNVQFNFLVSGMGTCSVLMR